MNLIERLLMPDCNRVRRVLQAYLDGELDDRQFGMVAAHLEHCERCGIEAELYQRVKDSLQGLRPSPDPAAMSRLRTFADSVAATDSRDGEDPVT